MGWPPVRFWLWHKNKRVRWQRPSHPGHFSLGFLPSHLGPSSHEGLLGWPTSGSSPDWIMSVWGQPVILRLSCGRSRQIFSLYLVVPMLLHPVQDGSSYYCGGGGFPKVIPIEGSGLPHHQVRSSVGPCWRLLFFLSIVKTKMQNTLLALIGFPGFKYSPPPWPPILEVIPIWK